MRAIRNGDTGSAVEDVQKRLRALGFELNIDAVFAQHTAAAVRAFREQEGLEAGDEVDEDTWHALVDATFSLGDRMLYLRMPHFHGRDVRDLQSILEVLGFVVGDPDGIFGAHTEHALREFQSSIGIGDDGIAGDSTFDAIQRLHHAWEGKTAASQSAQEYVGFARAAEALQRMEACFYGLDEGGRSIASRMANLAHATTPSARVTSAEALGNAPSQTMLMAGIVSQPGFEGGRIPIVSYSDDRSFPQRIRTAVDATPKRPKRLVVDVSAQLGGAQAGAVAPEAAEQHLAVMLLDAFCVALA